MSIARIFLDVQTPALAAAVEYLFERYASDTGVVDFQNVIVVVPGARAGRRLRELLITTADGRGWQYWPPEIVTVGRLPELLYEPKFKLATTLVQNVAWADALKKTDAKIVRHVISRAPSTNDHGAWRDVDWLDYGTLLCTQYRALAAESLTFSDVAMQTSQMRIGRESRRWNALATIQQLYLQQLDKAQLWDRQTARVVAVRHQEIQTNSDIILLGTADMNRVLRDMLSQIPRQITALIHAPVAWQDRFDEFGCLIPAAWQNLALDIPDKVIVHVDGPEEQAAAVGLILREYDGRFAPEEITIGIPDSQLVAFVQRELASQGLQTYWAGGRAMRQSEPYLLLRAVADYLTTASAGSVAALVRHPRIAERIGGRTDHGSDWLVQLDQAYQEHLPTRLFVDCADSLTSKTLRQFSHLLPKLCGDLDLSEKRLPQWALAIEEFLIEMYSADVFDHDVPEQSVVQESALAIQQSLAEMHTMPQDIAPLVTAAEAIRYVLADVETQLTAIFAPPDAIELLGWLELALDDAPALLVTSLQERFIPQSVTSDLFLPNALREKLGIDDNARRYARDAYALSTLIRSREHLHLIVARRNVDGDPELPSRLLLAEEPQTITRRCLRFFDEPSLDPLFESVTHQVESAAETGQSRFAPPRPETVKYQPVEQLSPTAFRSYIACKYRFFLRHVVKIEPVSEDLAQMDAREFGNLMHDVLESLGNHRAMRDCSDEQMICSFLSDELDQQARRKYGFAPPATVRIQVEGMRLRLKAFAEHQARRVADGWRIAFAEQKVECVFPRTNMKIVGKMDRIDVHQETNDWAVFDYKTGDAGKTPEAAHRTNRRTEWIDLQLPIYRHLARTLAADPASPRFSGQLRLGYVILPSDTKSVSFEEAQWTDADLTDADQRTREIIEQVQANDFWPPTDPPPSFSEWAAAICLDHVLEHGSPE